LSQVARMASSDQCLRLQLIGSWEEYQQTLLKKAGVLSSNGQARHSMEA
jgi:hypothetical protein